MVKDQISARGVKDPRVLDALLRVPREWFVQAEYQNLAYHDRPLPIEQEQTISQPYIVALMVEALRLDENSKVLEVGTGSGYAAAVTSKLADQVYTIERHQVLAETAARRLRDLGYHNVHVRHGDGTLGWPEQAPFDGIVVAAGGSSVPEALKQQLKIGGRLVIPVGGEKTQSLVLITRLDEKRFEEQTGIDVRFVPLLSGKA